MENAKDGARFSAAMTTLEKYFEKQLETSVKLVYFQQCADFTIEQFEQACALALARLKWFPKIAELRELAEGNAEDKAAEAWGLFEKAVARVGYYTSLWVEDAALAEAIRLTFGGWTQACTAMHPVYAAYDRDGNDTTEGRQVGGLGPEMIAAKRKEFMANYRNALRRGGQSDRYFAGCVESENRNTIGSWKRGALPASMDVGLIVGNVVSSTSLPVDPHTAALAGVARQMLESGEARRLIEAPKPKMLPPAVDEVAPTLNLDEAIATRDEAFSGIEMLKNGLPERLQSKRDDKPARLSPEEIVARVRHLREQAAMLSGSKESAMAAKGEGD